jgi:plasmid stabilization system protein ParE
MTIPIVLSWPARQDLRDARSYLLEQGEDSWPIVRRALRDAMKRISNAPGIGHAKPEITDAPVLFWVAAGYYIIYDPAARPILIARIVHAARDVAAALRHRA